MLGAVCRDTVPVSGPGCVVGLGVGELVRDHLAGPVRLERNRKKEMRTERKPVKWLSWAGSQHLCLIPAVCQVIKVASGGLVFTPSLSSACGESGGALTALHTGPSMAR